MKQNSVSADTISEKRLKIGVKNGVSGAAFPSSQRNSASEKRPPKEDEEIGGEILSFDRKTAVGHKA